MDKIVRKYKRFWSPEKAYLLLGTLFAFVSLTLTAHALVTVSNSGLFGDADVVVDGSGTLNLGTASSTAVVIGSSTTPVTIPGALAVNGVLTLGSASTTGQLLFWNASSSFTTLLQASPSLTSNLTFTLPSATGTPGQLLSTDGAGGLYFANASTSTPSQWVSGSNGAISYNGGSVSVGNTVLGSSNSTFGSLANSTKYGLVPGVSGDAFTSPDSIASSFTGDIDVRVNVAMNDWTPAANSVLMGKVLNSGQFSWDFYITATGFPVFRYSTNGVAMNMSTASVATGLTDGTSKWLRVTRSASTGDVTFYISDDDVTYTQLGATRSTTPGGMFDGTDGIRIGGNLTLYSAGKFYRGKVYNGINGTLALDFNPNNYVSGTAWTSTSGEVWTLAGTVSVVAVSPNVVTENGSVLFSTIVPVSTSMAIYNNSGVLYWNGAPLAIGGSSISGTTTYIPVFTSPSALGNSVITQVGNKVFIGTSTATKDFNVLGDVDFSGNIYKNGVLLNTSGSLPTGLLNSGKAVQSYGDSITAGNAASVAANRYVNLLATAKNWTLTNNSVSGTMVGDQATTIYPAAVSTGTISTLMIGTNDANTYLSDTNKQAAYGTGLMALIAWLAIPDANKLTAANAGVTYTGTWTSNSHYAGFGQKSVVSGSTATFSVYGKNVLIASEYETSGTGTYTVSVDGVSQGTFTTSAPGGVPITTHNGLTYMPTLIVVPNLPDGQHTVVLTTTNTSTVYFDWAAGTGGVSFYNGPTVYVGNIPRYSAVGYATFGGSDAVISKFNRYVEYSVSKLASMGLNVVMADVSSHVNPLTDLSGDGLHPSDLGHQHIADAFLYAANSVNYPSTRQIGAFGIPQYVGSTDPGCTIAGDIGKPWYDTTTTTTAYKVCLSVAGTLAWVIQ